MLKPGESSLSLHVDELAEAGSRCRRAEVLAWSKSRGHPARLTLDLQLLFALTTAELSSCCNALQCSNSSIPSQGGSSFATLIKLRRDQDPSDLPDERHRSRELASSDKHQRAGVEL